VSLLGANEVLTKTRDLLLPRLISGRLAVEDLDIRFPPGMAEAGAACSCAREHEEGHE
jgi:type I restriction enzyme S subunit